MQGGIAAVRVVKPFPTGTKLLQCLFARHEIPLQETSCLPLPTVSTNRGSTEFQVQLSWRTSAAPSHLVYSESICNTFVILNNCFTRGERLISWSVHNPLLIAETFSPTTAPRPELSR
jgi:hypothetical protein